MKCFKYVILVIFNLASFFNDNNAQSGSACTTPNGETAICTSIYSCKILYDTVTKSITPEQRQFLKKSLCGYDSGPLVCCGKISSYSTNTPNKTMLMSMRSFSNANKLRDHSSCGFQVLDRVYGGEKAGLSEFPWMALLQYRNDSGHLLFRCGGTLISLQYVLTAAHCLHEDMNNGWNVMSVRLGEYNTDTAKDCISQLFDNCNEKPVDAEIDKITVHNNFLGTMGNIDYDIALIRLKNPVTETEFIKPICLPSPSDSARVGQRVVVAGWGSTETARSSPVKRKVEVPIVEQKSCIQKFKPLGLNSNQICAGGEAGKDSCTGDSGGPLMTTFANNSEQWYLEGIVSFGRSCGKKGTPAIYTRVTHYLDWISENVLD